MVLIMKLRRTACNDILFHVLQNQSKFVVFQNFQTLLKKHEENEENRDDKSSEKVRITST